MVTADDLERANARAVRMRETGPTAVSARYDRRSGCIVVRLNSGIDVGFSPRNMHRLESAQPAQLDVIEISPSGLGLHFPKLDADLYLTALLAAGSWLPTVTVTPQEDEMPVPKR